MAQYYYHVNPNINNKALYNQQIKMDIMIGEEPS